jgi:hypothetical protein
MYSSRGAAIDAFWRTLITNVTHDHQIATQDTGRQFMAFRMLWVMLNATTLEISELSMSRSEYELAQHYLKAITVKATQ